MKKIIEKLIIDFVKEYENRDYIETSWKVPLVGFADPNHPIIKDLKNIVIDTHHLPDEIIANPKTIISYFIPFKDETVLSNIKVENNYASREWAQAYKETNDMMAELNIYLSNQLRELGYQADYCHDAFIIDDDILYSNFSHRHIGYVAGLGTFGINNMFISKNGCCGRMSSVVTNIEVEHDKPLELERCLYKANGSCKLCLNHCFMNALYIDDKDFKRNKCFIACNRNQEKYGLERSVCGKCLVGLPCSLKVPINL